MASSRPKTATIVALRYSSTLLADSNPYTSVEEMSSVADNVAAQHEAELLSELVDEASHRCWSLESADAALAFVLELRDTFSDLREPLHVAAHTGDVIPGGDNAGHAPAIARAMTLVAGVGRSNPSVLLSAGLHDEVAHRDDVDCADIGERAVGPDGQALRLYRLRARSEAKSAGNIWQELSRRRVFRSAAAYVVSAWVILQVADILLPVYGAPDWSLRALTTTLIVGFPLAMLVTWSVNLDSTGLVITPDSRFSRRIGIWLRLSLLLVSAGISAIFLWVVWTPEPTGLASNPDRVKERPIVIVTPLVKRVGGDDIDWLGEGVSNLIRDALADSPNAIVYSVAALGTDAIAVSDPAEAARKAGVDYLVEGDLWQTSAGIVISTRIKDLGTGTIIPAQRIEADTSEGVLAATPSLIRRVRQSLGLPYEERVGQLAANFAAANVSGYELYINGLDALSRFSYDDAQKLLEASLDAAPSFAMARYRLAQILESTGRNQAAFDLLSEIDQELLSERERFYISGAKAKFAAERDLPRAIGIYQQMVAGFPFDAEARQNLAEAYWLDFQEFRALDELRKLVEMHPSDPASWMALAERLVDVAETDEAAVALEEYVRMRPDDAYPHTLLGDMALAQGMLERAREHFQTALSIRPDMGMARDGSCRLLVWRGLLTEAVSCWEAMFGEASIPADYRIDAAFALFHLDMATERFSQARQRLEAAQPLIDDEGFRSALSLALQALAATEQNQFAIAKRLLESATLAVPESTPPLRQLFYDGWLAHRQGDQRGVLSAADRLAALELQLTNPYRATRDGLEKYLRGLASIAAAPAEAERYFQEALGSGGQPLMAFERGLARALLAQNRAQEAASELGDYLIAAQAAPTAAIQWDLHVASKLLTEAAP